MIVGHLCGMVVEPWETPPVLPFRGIFCMSRIASTYHFSTLLLGPQVLQLHQISAFLEHSVTLWGQGERTESAGTHAFPMHDDRVEIAGCWFWSTFVSKFQPPSALHVVSIFIWLVVSNMFYFPFHISRKVAPVGLP